MRVALSVLLLGTAAAMSAKPNFSNMSGLSEPPAQLGATDAPYLIGRGPCVAIELGRLVDEGTRLLVLAANKKPTDVRIDELFPWTGSSQGGPRYPRTDCRSWFQEEVTDQSGNRMTPIKSLARVSIPPDEFDPFFALAPQPARIVIAGTPRTVGPAERRRLFEAVSRSVPASWALAHEVLTAVRHTPVLAGVNGTDAFMVIELDATINNPRFADACVTALLGNMRRPVEAR